MKINPVKMAEKVVRRNAKPINKAISVAELVVNAVPAIWMYIRFVATLPAQVFGAIKDTRHIGVYEFTDCKGATFNVLLEDAQAVSAYDQDNHPARQFVLAEVARYVAAQKGSTFIVPHALYLWAHPSRGFKRTEQNEGKGFRRIRDANKAEQKEYSGKLLRHAARELLASYTG